MIHLWNSVLENSVILMLWKSNKSLLFLPLKPQLAHTPTNQSVIFLYILNLG